MRSRSRFGKDNSYLSNLLATPGKFSRAPLMDVILIPSFIAMIAEPAAFNTLCLPSIGIVKEEFFEFKVS
jgi:hypothetical protein